MIIIVIMIKLNKFCCIFSLRVTVRKVKERFMSELDSNNKRVEFLPVEWRSSLKLDGGLLYLIKIIIKTTTKIIVKSTREHGNKKNNN